MAIITRAQLRKWFGRGQYPTAEQFSDQFDSFWHKEEDRIAIDRVEGLAEALNQKFAADDGQALEKANTQLSDAFERHKTEANEAIDQLREELQQFREEVETNYIKKTDTVVLDGGSPADLVNNI